MRGLVALLGILLLATAAWCGPALTYCDLLDRLVDLNGLPGLEPGVKCAQASSYDRASHDPKRWNANGDVGQYERVEPNGEAVMADLKGPGCLFRLWSANPQGKIRFYLDGATEPTYEFDFRKLFQGDFGVQQVPAPIVFQRPGDSANVASDCYLPIPFARSCKVTADRKYGQYYHLGYKLFPPGTTVPTFHLPLTEAESTKLKAVAETLAQMGVQPQNPGPGSRRTEAEVTLAGGEKRTVATLTGPAMVCELRAKVTGPDRYVLRQVMLRAAWDGEATPSVACPLGDFFGAAWTAPDYKSLPLGWTERGGYCFFRMPFANQASFELENQGPQPVQVSFSLRTVPLAGLPADWGTFHAKWRREAPCRQFDYPLLEAQGQGKFVGVMLFVEHPVPGWWGEGDEKIWVDGEDFPSTFGTGSEDYFGDAWGIRSDLRQPYHGDNYEQGPRSCCYRFHISDSVPFLRSYRMVIENYAVGGNDYSSVAYWYARPDSTDFFQEATWAEREPWGRFVAGAVQAETLFADSLPAGAKIVDDALLPGEFSGHRAVDLGQRQPGDQLGPATLKVEKPGAYYVELIGLPTQPVAGLTVSLDGRPLTPHGPVAATGAVVYGPRQLTPGDHALIVGVSAPTGGLLDCLALRRTRSEGTVEAETAEVAVVNGPAPGTQHMTYDAGPLAGQEGDQLFFTPHHPGAAVSLALAVPAAGRYRLSWWASKSWDYGRYQAELDGQPVGEPVDLYARRWEVAAAEVTAEVTLTAGRHVLKLTAVGKNDASKGYFIGLDAVALDPLP